MSDGTTKIITAWIIQHINTDIIIITIKDEIKNWIKVKVNGSKISNPNNRNTRKIIKSIEHYLRCETLDQRKMSQEYFQDSSKNEKFQTQHCRIKKTKYIKTE